MAEIAQGYLQKTMKEQVTTVLEKENIVQLQQFCTPAHFENVKQAVLSLPFEKTYNPLIYKHSFAVPNETVRALLAPLQEYVEQLTHKFVSTIRIVLAEQGDYSVLHDDQEEETGYDAIFDLTDWDARWGGLVYYRYGDEEKKEVPCMPNSLVLVHKQKTRTYLKHINHYAQGKRIFILFKTA